LAISTEMVKTLREATSAGVLDCKKALEATDGDFDQAVKYLREKGLAIAAKKASRETNDGLVNVLVDEAGRLGAIVEVNCETDFVARTADFQAFVRAMVKQVAQETGWSRDELLTHLCTHRGGLPQGAPTSPRLSNLVNYPLDARLAGLAKRLGATYTRYADDMTFSFSSDDPRAIHKLIRVVKLILEEQGYAIHLRRKLQVRRRHQRQMATGLVVNTAVNLPRQTRRWLRAVRHRLETGQEVTLQDAELEGWLSLETMVRRQAAR